MWPFCELAGPGLSRLAPGSLLSHFSVGRCWVARTLRGVGASAGLGAPLWKQLTPQCNLQLLTAHLLPWQVDLRGWRAGDGPVQASVQQVLPGPGPHSGPGAGGAQRHAQLHSPRCGGDCGLAWGQPLPCSLGPALPRVEEGCRGQVGWAAEPTTQVCWSETGPPCPLL